MFRKMIFFILLSFFLSTNAYSGIVSKGAKAVAVVKVVSKVKKIKDGSKAILKKELTVGKYGKIGKQREPNLDYHHIPSTKQIEKYGINKKDGVSIGVQHDRHGLTRTYKNGNKKILKDNETMRESLARDVKDMRKIYRDNGLYNNNTREALKEVIKQNKESFPSHYKKVP